jgi:hypothetical protein
MSFKDRYPNQSYVCVPVLITGSNHQHVFAVIADHGLVPTKVQFEQDRRVEVWANFYVPVTSDVTQHEGDWGGTWERIKFLIDDPELISRATKMCAIQTNGAGNSFITSNANNKRPSMPKCE